MLRIKEGVSSEDKARYHDIEFMFHCAARYPHLLRGEYARQLHDLKNKYLALHRREQQIRPLKKMAYLGQPMRSRSGKH